MSQSDSFELLEPLKIYKCHDLHLELNRLTIDTFPLRINLVYCSTKKVVRLLNMNGCFHEQRALPLVLF